MKLANLISILAKRLVRGHNAGRWYVFDCVFSQRIDFSDKLRYKIYTITTKDVFHRLKGLHGSGDVAPQLTSLAGVSFMLFKSKRLAKR